jgi:colanic acid/amylovoran biosynthesis glycosyltransferase
MRIAYVTVAFPFGYGEAFFLSEVRELNSQGHEVLVVPRSNQGGFVHRSDHWILRSTYSESILSRNVARSSVFELLHRPLKSLSCLRLLFRSHGLRTLGKNLIVYPKGLWLGRLVRDLGVDHIHAQWASTTSSMALIASEVSGVPWSFTAHRGDIAANNLFEVKLQRAAFVRFISKSGIKMARTFCAGGLQGKERLIHMGVDLPELERRPETAEPTIVCPAILTPVKGHRFLLESIALLRNRGLRPRLELIGDGPLRGELEEMVVRLGIGDCVQFLGQMPQEDLIRRYSSSRVAVVVLSSVDLGSNLCEGIPVSLMEAMSFGVPVISTSTGGIPELLEGGAGIIVPPEDPVALANAIESVVLNPGLGAALAEKGRERVASDFNTRSSVKKLLECMASICSQQTEKPVE